MKKGYDYDKLLRLSCDLEQRHLNLIDTKKILDKLGIRFWLYEGALLGIYRDGDFIPWDWDLDFLVFTEEILISGILQKIKKSFKLEGFKVSIKKHKGEDNYPRLKIGIIRNGDKLSINGYNLDKKNNVRTRIPYRFPCKLFEGGGHIEFKGIKYPCPSPIEDYLELSYGDWKTPIKSGNPDEYRRGRGKHSKDVEDKYKRKIDDGEYDNINLKTLHSYKKEI